MPPKEIADTPLMRQHRSIKEKYPDAVLLFRVGDFYETFGEDAHVAARVLGITLTKRSNGAAASVDLAGFPHHSLETYLHKLVKAGYRVAVCDQLEDPKTVKGLVKRGVTEMVSPGVTSSDKMLDHKSNNFLAAVYLGEPECGAAFLDISTGEFLVGQGSLEYVDKLLQSFRPAEVIVAKHHQKRFREQLDPNAYLFALDEWIFRYDYGRDTLLQHFRTHTLKGFGTEDLREAMTAAGAAIHYLKDTAHPNLSHFSTMQRIVPDSFLWMDRFTIRNLELFGDGRGASLFDAIDRTLTPMGGRLLKRWLLFPLTDLERIRRRQEAVTHLIRETDLSAALSGHLKQTGDLERLAGKIALRKAGPRSVYQLARGLQELHGIHTACRGHAPLEALFGGYQSLEAVREDILRTLEEECPADAAKGNFIRTGIIESLDELRHISRSGKEYLLRIQQEEAARTGIHSLKVAFNNVFGYYLEVTHTHKDKVPADWIRKQTLTNAERYITPELKEYEEKILGAEEKMLALEQDCYQQLLARIEPHVQALQDNCRCVARLDCLLSFATTARVADYHRPTVSESDALDIRNGRHPVIEQQLPPGTGYIGNDLHLDRDTLQMIILTGPNMSGKSALLRQTAIITILAHMGSYVPADAAEVGLTDKIFTRVGASDNLSGGESTFMVEMNETASIVNNISARSLVLLDEIGRGTSTYDGISIAWSIAEFLHQSPQRPKTLFATHYHELNELEAQLPRLKNFHITHQEAQNRIVFLRKLAPGGSRHSFGIQVARMAGLPPALLRRAEEILQSLEALHQDGMPEKGRVPIPAPQLQLNIFDGIADDLRSVQKVLLDTDINTLTPVEALLKLQELKQIVQAYKG